LRRRDEQHRGFRGMRHAEVREVVESAIQDAADCRCRRFSR
jgi:hypothetical protein